MHPVRVVTRSAVTAVQCAVFAVNFPAVRARRAGPGGQQSARASEKFKCEAPHKAESVGRYVRAFAEAAANGPGGLSVRRVGPLRDACF